jgi:hypothetical protein
MAVSTVATLRARLGWASGRSLFYATGGVAFMGENDNRAAGVGGTGGAGGNSGDGLYFVFDESGSQDNDFFALRGRLTYHMQGDDPLNDASVIANWSGLYFGINGGGLYGTAGVAFARDDNFDGNVLVGVGAAGGNGGDGGDGIPVNFGSPCGRGGAGDTSTVVVKNKDDTDVGFVIGTGTDVKLGERISISMEGLFYGFEEDKIVFFADGKRAGSLSADNDFYAVRARLTYHLQ